MTYLVLFTGIFTLFNSIYEITFEDSLDQYIVNFLTSVICLIYIVAPYNG